jgi:AbrB family looped-hinge helix DNA binding protein
VEPVTEAKVSPKYQVVIPKEIRDQMHIKSGQKVRMLAKAGVIYMVPEVSLRALKGTLKGVPAGGFREKKDRL